LHCRPNRSWFWNYHSASLVCFCLQPVVWDDRVAEDSERLGRMISGGFRVRRQCSSAVEQRFRKPSVAGSIPAIGSIILTNIMKSSSATEFLKEIDSLSSEVHQHRLLLTDILARLNKKTSSGRKLDNEVDYREAARLLGKCCRQVKRYVDAGELPIIDRGWRSKYFNREAVLSFKAKLEREGSRIGRPKGS
jgi:hypothetical protein